MTAAASAAADQQETSAKDDTDNHDAEDNTATDQGDDTRDDAEDSDKSDDEDWKAKFEAQQRINRNLERRTKRDKARIAELEGGKPAASTKDKPVDDKSGDVDVEKIRADALEQAKKETQQEALKERVLDKIEAKAAKGFADPADAVAILMHGRDITEFIDDGKVDVDAIQDALTELLEKKPHLGDSAAQGGKPPRFQGSAEGGAKPPKPSRPQSLDEAVRRRLTPK